MSEFFFFCGRSAVLRPSVHLLPVIGWCGAGLGPFLTACLWLTHPAAITVVSVSADETVLEDVVDSLFRFFAIAECRVHDANLLQVRSQATVSCSQPEYSGLLMSCQTVDWVSRGVVISSGSFPLTFLSVSEQGFGFLVSVGGHGLQLFAPRLSQAICSFISWNPTVGRDPLLDHGAIMWEKLQVSQQLVDWLVRGIGG